MGAYGSWIDLFRRWPVAGPVSGGWWGGRWPVAVDRWPVAGVAGDTTYSSGYRVLVVVGWKNHPSKNQHWPWSMLKPMHLPRYEGGTIDWVAVTELKLS